MKLRRLATIAVLLVSTLSQPGAAQFASLGLSGGRVCDIATWNDGGSTELLIATDGGAGIYRCGLSGWEPVFKSPCHAAAIEADLSPGNAGVAWAIIDGRVQVHRPGGPWDASGWSINKGINRADTLGGHTSGMYIGGDGTVYRSTDGGQSLAPLATFAGKGIDSIAVYDKMLFCVVSGGSLYRCQDDGNGFVVSKVDVAAEGASVADLSCVAIDPADSRNSSGFNRFFVWGNDHGGNLYRTDDGGKTWVRFPVGVACGQPATINFISFRGKRRLFIGNRYSDNNGQTWNDMPETTIATTLGFVAGHATGHMIVGDPNAAGLVYFTSDLAVGQWDMTASKAAEVHNAVGVQAVAVSDVAQIGTDAATRTIVWAATNCGLGKTMIYPATADGIDWLFPVRPQDDAAPLTAVALHPANLDIVLAGDSAGTIYQTTTGGASPASWSAVFSTRNAPFDGRYAAPGKAKVTAIKAVGEESTIVYAATAVSEGNYEGAVYRSLNNGTTWDDDFASESGLNLNMPVNDLALLDNMVWAGVGHPSDPRPDSKGLYARLSVNEAAKWWKMPTSTELDSQAVLAVDSARIGGLMVLYAATDQGVYSGRLDSSSGSTWTWRSISPNGRQRYVAVAADPDNPNRLCAAHDNSIWVSSDGGFNWGLVPPSGTAEFDQVTSLLYRDLIVGTSCGLVVATEGMFDDDGRIRVSPGIGVPASQPSVTVAATPQGEVSNGQDVLPFRLPGLFGFGLAETVGIWLPLLAWLAITRHNRSK